MSAQPPKPPNSKPMAWAKPKAPGAPPVPSSATPPPASRLGALSQAEEDFSAYPAAHANSRVAALLIDGLFATGSSTLVVAMLAIAAGGGPAAQLKLSLVSYLIYMSYFIVPTALYGQTLGKKLLKVRVVRMDGSGEVGFGIAFARETIGRTISGLPLCLGYLGASIRDDRRTFHDLIFGTRVVSLNRE